MNRYDIWMDGFAVSGNRQRPQLLIEDVIANTFEDACFISFGTKESYSIANRSLWGCKLYQSEKECWDPSK